RYAEALASDHKALAKLALIGSATPLLHAILSDTVSSRRLHAERAALRRRLQPFTLCQHGRGHKESGEHPQHDQHEDITEHLRGHDEYRYVCDKKGEQTISQA